MNNSIGISFWIGSLILSLLFSGMEVAFIFSDKLRYALDKNNKGPLHFIQKVFYSHPRKFLSTLTIGNLLVLIVFVYYTIVLSQDFVNKYITQHSLITLLVQAIAAFIIIVLTSEFIPRIIFKNNANMWVKVLSLPLFILYVLLYPVTKFFTVAGSTLLRIVGIKFNPMEEKALGRVELNTYVKQGIDEIPIEGGIDSEVKIFKNALDFSSVRLRDCMVPRTDIVALSKYTPLEELKEKFIETGLSKILVYEEDIDDIIGYIHMWEMFDTSDDWEESIAKISFYPESMLARDLMTELLQQHKTIAVVVDEFGGTSGIITMEDLVEEIFGDIEDEYDVNTNIAKQISDNEFILSGRLEIDQLNELFDLNIPHNDDYSTVAGYILHHIQRFPTMYESIDIDRYTFKILKVTQRKIEITKLVVNHSNNDS